MKLIFVLVFGLLFSPIASAVCNVEDLIGYWDYYEEDDDMVLQCSLRIGSGGRISLHRFGCKSAGNIQTPSTVTGTASIDSYCHVSALLTLDSGLAIQIVQATLVQSRSMIVGIGANSSGGVGAFSLVKFY